jgi:hypothetical protein
MVTLGASMLLVFGFFFGIVKLLDLLHSRVQKNKAKAKRGRV